jgi:hypothetical protein
MKLQLDKIQQISPRLKDEVDDAMLTKRPLHNQSFCASCDKEVLNLYQKKYADFQSWKKLPFRNPGDRIAKVG